MRLLLVDEHWLLRHPNGDAFAIALLPYVCRERYSPNPPEWNESPPVEFDFLIHDDRNDTIIDNYDYECIPQIEWETLQAFGIPLVRVVIDDDYIFLAIK